MSRNKSQERIYTRRENSLNAWRLACTMRSLTNPDIRVPLRADFPPVMIADEAADIKEMLAAELRKQGKSLSDVGRISIAYPHKHPEIFPGYEDNAIPIRNYFLERMRECLPEIDWISADAICETVSLNRSGDQSILHMLTGRQLHDIHMPSQKEPLPFLDAMNEEKEFFVIVDWRVAYGTTVNNLRSYIEHNGGHVLGVVSGNRDDLVQKIPWDSGEDAEFWEKVRKFFRATSPYCAQFADAARNTGALPYLAKQFALSAHEAGRKMNVSQCMERFERVLNGVGNTVFSLTHGECRNLKYANFPRLMQELEKSAKPVKVPKLKR